MDSHALFEAEHGIAGQPEHLVQAVRRCQDAFADFGLSGEHGGAVQVHYNSENLLDDLVLQVGRYAVAILYETKLGELAVQPGGFRAGTAAAVAQLVCREGNHGAQCCPQDHPAGDHLAGHGHRRK